MTSPIMAVQLAWWMRIVVALVLLAVVLPGVVVVVATARRVVLVPRSRGERWPVGVGWGGLATPAAEVLREVQTRDSRPSRMGGRIVEWFGCAALGCVAATFTVLPVTPTAWGADPSLGLFVLPVACLLVVVAEVVVARADGGLPLQRDRLAVNVTGVVALFASAGAAAAQWSSGRMSITVGGQLHGALFTHTGFGLPTVLVQPVGAVAALVGVNLFASAGPRRVLPVASSRGLFGLLWRASIVVAEIAVATWVAAVYLGGPGVPWAASVTPAVKVFGVMLLALKSLAVLCFVTWERVRWPHHDRGVATRVCSVLVGMVGLQMVALAVARGMS